MLIMTFVMFLDVNEVLIISEQRRCAEPRRDPDSCFVLMDKYNVFFSRFMKSTRVTLILDTLNSLSLFIYSLNSRIRVVPK